MASPTKTHGINYNVLLDTTTNEQLIAISSGLRLSKAQVVRFAINHWALMRIEHTPVCADGQSCRCPHAHIYPGDRLAPGVPTLPASDAEA